MAFRKSLILRACESFASMGFGPQHLVPQSSRRPLYVVKFLPKTKRFTGSEEAAKQLSRRTHGANAADLRFVHTLEGTGLSEEIEIGCKTTTRNCHAVRSRSRNLWAKRIGTASIVINTIATAEATGQSRLLKNSSHSTLPIINVSGPPSRSGMTNSPMAGINTRSEPAAIPGKVSGKITPRKTDRGGAPRSAAASTRLWSSADKLP